MELKKEELEVMWRALARYSEELHDKVERRICSLTSSYEEYEERMNVCDALYEKAMNEWRKA